MFNWASPFLCSAKSYLSLIGNRQQGYIIRLHRSDNELTYRFCYFINNLFRAFSNQLLAVFQ